MHREYKRIVRGADRAILFVHGIVGTPNHFRDLVPLVPENISVYNILLDGHGKGVTDFSRTSLQKWRKQVAAAVDELAQSHKEIFICAHSLGCLLSLEQAVHDPRITKLFLLAVPLTLFLKPKMLRNCARVYFDTIDPENEELMAAKACYGIAQDKNLFHYLGWIPRYLELFAQMGRVRKLLPQLQTPAEAWQSRKDEMVARRSALLLRENPHIRVNELPNSGHYYYEKSDLPLLKDAFSAFIS